MLATILINLINFAQIVKPYDGSSVPNVQPMPSNSTDSILRTAALVAVGVLVLAVIVYLIRRSRKHAK